MIRTKLTLAWPLALLLAAPTLAQQTRVVTKAGPTPPAVKKDPNTTVAQSQVDAWLSSLPSWVPPKAPRGTPKAIKKSADKNVQRVSYSLQTAPEEIVAFAPIQGFWLGALVQETGVREGLGSTLEIPVESPKRAPFKLTTTLLLSDNTRTIARPSQSATQSALGELIERAVKAKKPASGSVYYRLVENHDAEQTAMELGLDAHYLGGSISAQLKNKSGSERHSISALFVEKAFTASCDFEGRTRRAAFFSDSFLPADGRSLSQRALVGPKNTPCYVSSITYGRMMLCTITSTKSASELDAALRASYEAGVGGGALQAHYKSMLSSAETQIEVASVGGPTKASADLIRSGKIADFFKTEARLDTMVPISYTIHSVLDQQLIALLRTTEYTVTTPLPTKPVGESYSVSLYAKLLDARDKGTAADIYGTLRLNGKLIKEWTRAASGSSLQQKKSGESMSLWDDYKFDYYYDKRPKLHIACELNDEDHLDDDNLGRWDAEVDLRELLGGRDRVEVVLHTKGKRSRNDGNADLHLVIEKLVTF